MQTIWTGIHPASGAKVEPIGASASPVNFSAGGVARIGRFTHPSKSASPAGRSKQRRLIACSSRALRIACRTGLDTLLCHTTQAND